MRQVIVAGETIQEDLDDSVEEIDFSIGGDYSDDEYVVVDKLGGNMQIEKELVEKLHDVAVRNLFGYHNEFCSDDLEECEYCHDDVAVLAEVRSLLDSTPE